MFIFFFLFLPNKYICLYPHRLRDLVSSVCLIFYDVMKIEILDVVLRKVQLHGAHKAPKSKYSPFFTKTIPGLLKNIHLP